MRFALVLVALVGCKVKKEEAPSAPIEVKTNIELGSGSALEATPPPAVEKPRSSRYPEMPNCDRYHQSIDSLRACDKLPKEAKEALQQAFDVFIDSIKSAPPETFKSLDDVCNQAVDALKQALEATGCEFHVEAVAGETPKGSRDVPSEKGVPLDRAVLGALPRPFGALQPIKLTMTRDEILHAIPDAKRDGENIAVPLGVEALTAKILIDTSDHISDIEIAMDPFPSDLFQQAWGASEDKKWLDRVGMWRADYGGGDFALHIFPYKRLVDVLGTGPDLLAEQTPMIGTSITKLKQKLGGRLDEWTEEDEDGNEVTRPRLLLPSTEVCHFDSLYTLVVENDIVTGATLSQCFDTDADRKLAMAAMEKRWGRATPARTADDRLVFRFSRPGRTVEMTEDPTVDPAGAWIVKIRR